MDPVVHAAAQQARTKPWEPNPGGARTLDDAIAFAASYGIVIEDDVRFVVFDADRALVFQGTSRIATASISSSRAQPPQPPQRRSRDIDMDFLAEAAP